MIQNWMAQPDCCTEYKEYSFEMFQEYSAAVFDKINQSLFLANSINLSEQLFEKIKKLVYAILRTKEKFTGFTGLIFTGFGEDEIYPQLIPVNISMVIDNKLRYYIDENQAASISKLIMQQFALLLKQM